MPGNKVPASSQPLDLALFSRWITAISAGMTRNEASGQNLATVRSVSEEAATWFRAYRMA
jgi:hypothetical protein